MSSPLYSDITDMCYGADFKGCNSIVIKQELVTRSTDYGITSLGNRVGDCIVLTGLRSYIVELYPVPGVADIDDQARTRLQALFLLGLIKPSRRSYVESTWGTHESHWRPLRIADPQRSVFRVHLELERQLLI